MKIARTLLTLAAAAACSVSFAGGAADGKTADREESLRQSGDPDVRRRADGTIQVEPKEKRVHPYADERQREQVEKARQKKLESKTDREAQ